MLLVVDTSVILAVVFNEPAKPELVRLTAGAELVAPLSLHWEIGNALSAMLKRKRITLPEALQALLEYHKIPIRFLEVPLDETIRVVEQLQIYAYDAYFVVCARQQSCPLISLDDGLQTAARAAQIGLVEVTL
ncbi:MAG: type II toxin-antitoxin system VapC family toxin [Roseiflexaceae bacterium]|nr:type II toxin-antitoxin system VapC family toxin [Roseiflexaceae bacterium]